MVFHGDVILAANLGIFYNFAGMKREELEIMAPVGSLSSLSAAARAGADAVYFGIAGLNMRSKAATNFTLGELPALAERCRRYGMRSYLTVNTIMYDSDMARMREIVDAAGDAGISAVIATDISTILYCRQAGLPVHISTQANISNTEAVRFYSQWAETVVLSRELDLDQVGAMHNTIMEGPILGPDGEPVRIEMFCHGALCMAVSGKCYLSLHAMDSSANRGACTQICRRSYRLSDKETDNEIEVDNEFLMSPKDLKTIHFLDRLVDAGVRVFKIEGRARGAEYVAATVSCYDEALRAICDGTYDGEKVKGWDERLARVFNRGFWQVRVVGHAHQALRGAARALVPAPGGGGVPPGGRRDKRRRRAAGDGPHRRRAGVHRRRAAPRLRSRFPRGEGPGILRASACQGAPRRPPLPPGVGRATLTYLRKFGIRMK